jgi:hypothetical protein
VLKCIMYVIVPGLWDFSSETWSSEPRSVLEVHLREQRLPRTVPKSRNWSRSGSQGRVWNNRASAMASRPRHSNTRPLREPSVDNDTCLLLRQLSLRTTHLVRQGLRTYAHGPATLRYLSPAILPNSELCRSAKETHCDGGFCWR